MNTPPRRVLFLAASAGGGGAEGAMGDLVFALHGARPGWDLNVLALEEGPLLDRMRRLLGESKVSVLTIPENLRTLGKASGWFAKVRSSWSVGRVVWSLRRHLRVSRPDLMHSNGLKMHLLTGLVSALPGGVAGPKPRVVWHLHDYPGSRRLAIPVLRFLAPTNGLALAVSESVAVDARAVFGDRLAVKTVLNAIDLTRFTPTGPALDLDAAAGLTPAVEGTVRVGLVATFARWKGHETFLRAAALHIQRKTRTPVRFYVVGGPIYATVGSQFSVEELRALGRAIGVDVGFTSFLEDVPAAMRALDVVVHASVHPEPFGLVLAQAMACGRALVTSGLGGAAELVRPGVDALTHRAGDAQDLARAISQLVNDPSLRARLGEAGRTAAGRFSRERLATELTPVYDALMAGRP